jgi:hypothetical protein
MFIQRLIVFMWRKDTRITTRCRINIQMNLNIVLQSIQSILLCRLQENRIFGCFRFSVQIQLIIQEIDETTTCYDFGVRIVHSQPIDAYVLAADALGASCHGNYFGRFDVVAEGYYNASQDFTTRVDFISDHQFFVFLGD